MLKILSSVPLKLNTHSSGTFVPGSADPREHDRRMREDIGVIRRANNIHSEKAVWKLQCAMTPGADNDTSVRLLMTGAAAGDPCESCVCPRELCIAPCREKVRWEEGVREEV